MRPQEHRWEKRSKGIAGALSGSLSHVQVRKRRKTVGNVVGVRYSPRNSSPSDDDKVRWEKEYGSWSKRKENHSSQDHTNTRQSVLDGVKSVEDRMKINTILNAMKEQSHDFASSDVQGRVWNVMGTLSLLSEENASQVRNSVKSKMKRRSRKRYGKGDREQFMWDPNAPLALANELIPGEVKEKVARAQVAATAVRSSLPYRGCYLLNDRETTRVLDLTPENIEWARENSQHALLDTEDGPVK